LERRSPDVYRAILDADIKSRDLFSGHGSALAQCYNHMIMPLANPADKRTQVIWGIKDFEHRFGRKPEGMWLPETAVDLETLDLLAEHGILFTILAQRQARRARKMGDKSWQEFSGNGIDPKRPYLCRLSSGKTISLFFYDGPISQSLAFGDLLDDGERFARTLAAAFVEEESETQLVDIATDGESYGHHHRFGDMALAYCLNVLESQGLAQLTNYGAFLEKYPPRHEVEIHENSSWSCVHGIERWRNDCGCCSGLHSGWHQRWRGPLREALDRLRDELARIYGQKASLILENPWLARDDYIQVILDRSPDEIERFLAGRRKKALAAEERVQVLRLLEMQRMAMLMYTSCGWFFDEISGIETVQILMYAGRAIQLARETAGANLEKTLIKGLKWAPGNCPDFSNGGTVYERLVRPAVLDLLRVGVHYAVSSLFEDYGRHFKIFCYDADREAFELLEKGKSKLALGRVAIQSRITLQQNTVSFAVLYLGDDNLMAAAREFMGAEAFEKMKKELAESYENAHFAEIGRLFETHFKGECFSLWHLFRDEQRKILLQIFKSAMEEINNSFRQIYGHQAALLQVAARLQMPLPRPLAAVAEHVMSLDIRESLANSVFDARKLRRAVENVRRFSLEVDKASIGYIVGVEIVSLMKEFEKNPEDVAAINRTIDILKGFGPLSLDLNLGKAQNIFFSLGKRFLPAMRKKAERGDGPAAEWRDRFLALGERLKVRIG
jgi:alpha-amylase/alpha-mannosidase (GH57 family)